MKALDLNPGLHPLSKIYDFLIVSKYLINNMAFMLSIFYLW